MAVTAIHPGEHLAEEVKELGMSAAELAQVGCSDQPHHRHFERTARDHRRHGLAPGPFLRHQRGVLAEFAKPVRPAHCRAKSWEFDKSAAQGWELLYDLQYWHGTTVERDFREACWPPGGPERAHRP